MANGILIALSVLAWFGFILPDLLRLQDGVLKSYGYLYYNTASALFDLTAAIGLIAASIVAARVAARPGADERCRAVTVGLIGILVVQVVIVAMIPIGFFLGVHFQ